MFQKQTFSLVEVSFIIFCPLCFMYIFELNWNKLILKSWSYYVILRPDIYNNYTKDTMVTDRKPTISNRQSTTSLTTNESELKFNNNNNLYYVIRPWWLGGRACGLITVFSLPRRVRISLELYQSSSSRNTMSQIP